MVIDIKDRQVVLAGEASKWWPRSVTLHLLSFLLLFLPCLPRPWTIPYLGASLIVPSSERGALFITVRHILHLNYLNPHQHRGLPAFC